MKDEANENNHSLTITYYKDGIHIEGFSFFEYQTKEAIVKYFLFEENV